MRGALALFSIIGIMSVFVLLNLSSGQNTGAIIDEIGMIRADRLEQIREGFPHGRTAYCQERIRLADQLLRLNTHRKFYDSSGLLRAEEYFFTERKLYNLLNTLTASEECPELVQIRAAELLSNVSNSNLKLIEAEIDRSYCDTEQAEQELLLADAANTTEEHLERLQKAAELARECR